MGRGGGRPRHLSMLAACHPTLVPALKTTLEREGRNAIMIVLIIQHQDFAALREAGAAAILPPGTDVTDAAEDRFDVPNRRPGYRH
jgi:methylmalonyl-CoA mutase